MRAALEAEFHVAVFLGPENHEMHWQHATLTVLQNQKQQKTMEPPPQQLVDGRALELAIGAEQRAGLA